MRIEKITMYSNKADDMIENEYVIYTKDELIKYIKENNIDLSEYCLELYAPRCFKCSIEILEDMDVFDEFFFNEEDKEITLYMN